MSVTHTNFQEGIMSASNKKIKTDNATAAAGATAKDLEVEAEVLFQRMYNKWYAFTVVDDDCLVTEVSEEEVQKRSPNKRAPKGIA